MYAKIVMANARMLVRGTYEPDEKLDGEVLKRQIPEGGDSVDEARLWKMVDELLADKKILQREKEELRAQLAEVSRLLEEARSQLQAPAKNRGTGTRG